MSGHSSTSPAATQPGLIDYSSFLNLPESDDSVFPASYPTPKHSPPTPSPLSPDKTQFNTRPTKTETAATSLLSTNQPFSGPSHQYDLYKQQTGIVPGALATTLAVSQSSAHLHGFTDFPSFDYLGMDSTGDFDFNGLVHSPDMDMQFESSPTNTGFLFESTVNPSSIGGAGPSNLTSPPSPSPLPALTSNVGRLWPGMHQQAAQARLQQQKQQQQQQQQQQQEQEQRQRQGHQQAKQVQKSKSPRATDPFAEQKISELLDSMRAKPSMAEPAQSSTVLNLPRPRKDEDEMDEDERLLASEEGKKLSSKERRQLRNKVSARAFRSRRKEYISQLETDIARKTSENGELRAQNNALLEENKRLRDLTRMLLSSPSFNEFLDNLSSGLNIGFSPDGSLLSQPGVQPQAQPQPQQQEQPQIPKDVNPYSSQHQSHHQQIGLAMIPEPTIASSMLGMNVDGFSFQPQVYSVLETPEPMLNPALLSGKTSSFEPFDSDEDKVDMPVIERPAPPAVHLEEDVASARPAAVDEAFESDPAFALYHDSPVVPEEPTQPTAELDVESLSQVDIFGGIEPEKAFARYELVDATEEEVTACLAMARVQRIEANVEAVAARLELLTVGLSSISNSNATPSVLAPSPRPVLAAAGLPLADGDR